MVDMENDTSGFSDHASGDMDHMTDTLKILEGEPGTP